MAISDEDRLKLGLTTRPSDERLIELGFGADIEKRKKDAAETVKTFHGVGTINYIAAPVFWLALVRYHDNLLVAAVLLVLALGTTLGAFGYLASYIQRDNP